MTNPKPAPLDRKRRKHGERLNDYLKRTVALQVSICTGSREPDDGTHDDRKQAAAQQEKKSE